MNFQLKIADINTIVARQPIPAEFIETATFLTSKKRTPLLVDSEGQTYAIIRKSDTKTFWRCVQHKKASCPGRAVTASNWITKKSGAHTHESDLADRVTSLSQLASVTPMIDEDFCGLSKD